MLWQIKLVPCALAYLNPGEVGGAGSSVRGMICPPGLNRVNRSDKFLGEGGGSGLRDPPLATPLLGHVDIVFLSMPLVDILYINNPKDVQWCNRRFGNQTMHPTLNFTSMNLLKCLAW